MSFSPFTSADAKILEDLVSAKGREIFKKYDVNGDGVLDSIETKNWIFEDIVSTLPEEGRKEVIPLLNEDEGLLHRLKTDFGIELDDNNNLSFDKWLFYSWDRLVKSMQN